MTNKKTHTFSIDQTVPCSYISGILAILQKDKEPQPTVANWVNRYACQLVSSIKQDSCPQRPWTGTILNTFDFLLSVTLGITLRFFTLDPAC